MPGKEKFELNYDPEKVRESLRARAEKRGVRVGVTVISAGTRIGNYKPQSQKRKDYNAV
jgi:hypothetical protein